MNRHSVPMINPDVAWRRYLKGVVIDPDLALNETAATIFLAIDGQRSVMDIAAIVEQAYSVSLDQATGDCITLLQALIDDSLVTCNQSD